MPKNQGSTIDSKPSYFLINILTYLDFTVFWHKKRGRLEIDLIYLYFI